MNSPAPPPPGAFLLLSLALALGGCAAQTSARYPSLLPRAIESRSDAEPEAAIAIAEPDPTTDAALRDLRKTLDKTNTDFAAAAQTAERLANAAKGDAVGGERWIAAQTALADLDGYRATTSSALSDLDALALARGADGKPDYPATTVLRDLAQAALDDQTARIAHLAAQLPGA